MKSSTTFAVEIQQDAVDAADKPDGGVPRPSRVRHLALLTATFCALVFYAHYGVPGSMASALFKPPVTVSSLPSLASITIDQNSGRAEQPVMVSEGHAPLTPQATVLQATRSTAVPAPTRTPSDHCDGRYIYMYDMPPRFNVDLLRDCGKGRLHPWLDMCPYVANDGMGQPLADDGGVFPGRGWYSTDQFMLDLIFHARMKRYECLTKDPSLAAAVFVPFYAGLESGRYLYNYSISTRDALQLDAIDWLVRRPEWRAMGGRDHFLVAGRTTWEFRREADVDELWGTKLLTYPAVENMTAFVLETSPLTRSNFAVPYPTYFHPEAAADVLAWQERLRKVRRRWLFSFAGAPRPGSKKTVRAQIIRQCRASSLCNLFHCGGVIGGGAADCNSPAGVMRVFETSDFCLEPRGDTATRRSTFDAILAGCIPVFFHPGSAYTQYTLHFPRDHGRYSVLIPHAGVAAGNVSMEETLRKIPPEEVRRMREEVVRLIPRVVYADPRSRRVGFRDAFDVALEAVIGRVAKRRRGEAAGR
ncbi:xyloglucan galactosyltransferase KATAMARI1 homolog [Triticum urartu]|uniref:xyloglucan galactosyltransferase KATAMARI1 homolog n=1 Tax=Triticum urartu TaxID=4572 RepID=UPI0020441D56|nr:xyloglucan galactosyltransferase KATAMARI1 homolog [Triticum urartu]